MGRFKPTAELERDPNRGFGATLGSLAGLPLEPPPGTEATQLSEEPLPDEGPALPTDVDCPVHPTAGYVAMVRERPATRTKSGLLLPEHVEEGQTEQEAQMKEMLKPLLPAMVTAVGDEIENIPTPCKVGDRILTAGPAYGTYEDEWFIYELVPFSRVTAVIDPPEDN